MSRLNRRRVLRTGLLALVPVPVAPAALALPVRTQSTDLARELEAAKAAGLPIDASELVPAAPASERNAAPLLERWEPADAAPTRTVTAVLRPDATEAEFAAAREELKAGDALLTLLHDIAARPACVRERELARGLLVESRQVSSLRDAARWLCAQSRVRERDGDMAGAVDSAVATLTLARHIDAEPLPLPHLVANAARSIGLTRLQELLKTHAAEASIRKSVGEALGAEPSDTPPAALRSGIVLARQCGAWLTADDAQLAELGVRQQDLGDEGYLSLLALVYPRGGLTTGMVPPRAEKEARRRWARDSVAEAVRAIRQVLTGEKEPGKLREELTERAAACVRKSAPSPCILALALLPEPDRFRDGDRATAAHWRVVRCAAALLETAARTGSAPEAPSLPMDPFSGRPLGYRKAGAGFALWSVGRGGAFDGNGENPQEAVFHAAG